MNYLAQYTIPFSGLKEGKHIFDFEADDRFFSNFTESEIRKGKVSIKVVLEKHTTHLKLTFEHQGVVELICDLCLDVYDQVVEGRNFLLVKFSENEMDEGDDVIFMHPGKHQVEVGTLIYEYIVLSIPIKRVHPNDENGFSQCDPEMLKKLEELRVDEQPEEPVDPRWNELKKIIGN